jgi:hypothetical protein
MMRTALAFFLLIIISGFLFAASTSKGKTGMSFLKVGVDARAMGMGGAYTALTSDASATYWNPAGLVNAKSSNVLFNHNEWIEDVRGEFAALSLVGKKSAWGMHVRSFSLGGIEVRSIPSDEPVEETSSHNISAGLSYARRIGSDVDLGVTLKYLFEKIYIESASGYAVDFGLIYRSPVPHLRLGAAIQNIGKMNELQQEATKLPVITRLGALYNLNLVRDVASANVAVDFVKPTQENARFHFGAEFLVYQQIAIRAGFAQGYEARQLSFGAGILRSAIRLDYAVTPFDDDLGVTHRFTVNFAL